MDESQTWAAWRSCAPLGREAGGGAKSSSSSELKDVSGDDIPEPSSPSLRTALKQVNEGGMKNVLGTTCSLVEFIPKVEQNDTLRYAIATTIDEDFIHYDFLLGINWR